MVTVVTPISTFTHQALTQRYNLRAYYLAIHAALSHEIMPQQTILNVSKRHRLRPIRGAAAEVRESRWISCMCYIPASGLEQSEDGSGASAAEWMYGLWQHPTAFHPTQKSTPTPAHCTDGRGDRCVSSTTSSIFPHPPLRVRSSGEVRLVPYDEPFGSARVTQVPFPYYRFTIPTLLLSPTRTVLYHTIPMTSYFTLPSHTSPVHVLQFKSHLPQHFAHHPTHHTPQDVRFKSCASSENTWTSSVA